MRRIFGARGALAGAALVCVLAMRAELCAAEQPMFEEVFSLIRSNLAGVKEADLDRAALQGLLQQLQGRAVLITNTNAAATEPKSPEPMVTRTNIFEGTIGYLRIERVEKGLGDQVVKAFSGLNPAQKIKGLIVDLRGAAGGDHAAAAAAAEKFLAGEKALLQIEGKTLRSAAATRAVPAPVVVLVNRQTVAAAESFAAILRKTESAIVIGAPTPGQSGVFMEYALKNGQRLRLASGMVRLGDGSPLTGAGVKPDIAVEVSPEEEKSFLNEPFGTLDLAARPGTATPRRRMNEAELVRRQREGQNTDEEEFTPAPGAASAAGVEKGRRFVRDPVLARALDILKGLALLKSAKAN